MAELTAVQKKFILHWGEMGTRWGINRTVAQVHALLYLSTKPLPADEIAETLAIARSNASTSLRELQSWGIVKASHSLGDRRDHFESMKDVWEMFQLILNERKRREVDPTLALLRECLQEIEAKKGSADRDTRERIGNLLDFFETISSCQEELRGLPAKTLAQFVKIRGKISKLLGGGR